MAEARKIGELAIKAALQRKAAKETEVVKQH